MKAIIISNTEENALLDQLELEMLKIKNLWPNRSKVDIETIIDAHRAFHYVVTRWFQEMGADIKR